jgi:hypothetical protein
MATKTKNIGKPYHVEFSIEVHAANPEDACKQAWKQLTEDAALPIGIVTTLDSDNLADDEMAGDRTDVDLEELKNH